MENINNSWQSCFSFALQEFLMRRPLSEFVRILCSLMCCLSEQPLCSVEHSTLVLLLFLVTWGFWNDGHWSQVITNWFIKYSTDAFESTSPWVSSHNRLSAVPEQFVRVYHMSCLIHGGIDSECNMTQLCNHLCYCDTTSKSFFMWLFVLKISWS